MPSLVASVQYGPGWRAFEQKIAKAPPELEATLRRAAPQIARPLAQKVKKAQSSSSERMVSSRLAQTTRATSKGGLPAVRTGGPPFTNGAEYGGQNRYAYTSQPVWGNPVSRPYKKHLTRQFRPFRGRRGYEVWPTIREGQDALLEGYQKAFDRAMKRVGLI